MADKVSPNGDVSPVCAATPRAIDLSKAGWTLQEQFVTCKRCLKALANRKRNADVQGGGDERGSNG